MHACPSSPTRSRPAAKNITRNGESHVALVDTARLDYYHRLEREHVHLMLIDDAEAGLEDLAAGRTSDARSALKKRRAAGLAD